ncbi:MAG: radical SAM protein, partial [Deltaproteobacteria bacterium]|nr:radical SAM protein [Deltaproteobacteria bacterium]
DLLTGRFGRRFLDYRAAWDRASLRQDPGPFPLSLDLAINSGCQLSCLMCPLPSRPAARRYEPMEEGLFLDLMAQASERALPALTLGLASEPLLNPAAARYASLADRAGIMDIRLGTNGQALDGPAIDQILDSGLTRLEISLDAADGVTYRGIRQGGSFSRVTRAIDLFLERRAARGLTWPLLRLSFLELPRNLGQLPLFLARWGQAADMVSIQRPIWFPGSRLEKPSPPTAPPPAGQNPGQAVCPQPWQRLGLDHLGRAWPCCSWYGQGLLPLSAASQDVASIWGSDGLSALRAAHLGGRLPGPCRECALSGAL